MLDKTRLRWFGAAALAASLLATSACSDPAASGGSGSSQEVSLVGFSVMKTANKQVIADFQKTAAGKDVTFKQS
ncbi:MAG: Sulfate transport system substrate-binding protein, partial [Marmoricola sp.]|nr:Sulfate transport system substrate-binding protein [Marmoricola sp.]